MAFLSEGVKSPCPRGVQKILVFVLVGKKLQFFERGEAQEKVYEGGKFSEKCLRGVKLSKQTVRGQKKCPRGGKIVKINCLRG